MNARQKEKRYKQKYEQLKNAYMKPLFEVRHRVDRVRFTKAYPKTLMIEDQFPDIVRNDLIKGLTNQLNDYVEYKIWENPLMDTVIKIEAEIKVVRPEYY